MIVRDVVRTRFPGRVLTIFFLLWFGASFSKASTSYTFTQIDFPGSTYTAAYGINDAGQIVGEFGLEHGFLKSGSSFTQIDFPGAAGTAAYGINDAGQIVGEFYDIHGNEHGFLKSGSSFTQIDVPGVINGTKAYGINDAGQIVGIRFGSSSFFDKSGFLKSGSSFTPIDVPFGDRTEPRGINDAGVIVGGIGTCTFCESGFVKCGSSSTQLDFPGIIGETEAYGINDAGLIVGDFFDEPGEHGFIATPVPEPGSLALYSAGVLALFGYLGSRRRTPRGDLDSDLTARR